MLQLHIDTAALGIPGTGADDSNVFEASLRRLLWLRNDAPSIFANITRSATASSELATVGHYPSQQEVSDWIEHCGVGGVYSPKDVWNVFVALISRTKSLAEHCNVEVEECAAFSATPDIDEESVGLDLLPLTQNAFASVSLSNHRIVPGLRLLCTCVGLNEGEYHLEFSCRELPATLDGNYAPGVSYEGTAICIAEANPFIHLVPEKIWIASNCIENLHLAIHLKALAILKGAGGSETLPRFSIGSEFIDSLQRNQCLEDGRYASAVLECCARVLAGQPKNSLNEFGARGEEDIGFRTHISKGHEALRLMFWKSGDEIEFANVGPKQELEIKMGNASQKYSTQYTALL